MGSAVAGIILAITACRHPPPQWPLSSPSQPPSLLHSGGEGMGSDAGVGPTRRRVPPLNGLAKDVPSVNGMRKEEPPPPRLLTLPTVLTIGRVAAVPLLISNPSVRDPWQHPRRRLRVPRL